MERSQKRLARRLELLASDQMPETFRPRDDLEVRELDLERHGPSGDLCAIDALPGVAGDPGQLGRQPFGVALVFVKRPFRADGLVRPVGIDLALVDPTAN